MSTADAGTKAAKPKVAVLLFNLGGPEKPADVQGFLYNLFADKRIIGLPFGLRQAVAAMISSRRAPMAQKNYALMGGGSPILKETRAQADALQAVLDQSLMDAEARVFIGMRYWHPFIEATAEDIAAWQPDHVVVLPLYPQFSSTTTLSGFDAFRKAYKGLGQVHQVCCYAGNPHFIKAHVEVISAALASVTAPENYRLLFSAHGLPESIVKRGDPYQEQVEASVRRVMEALSVDMEYTICYQSRVGPMTWIGPSTDDTIREAGRDGKSVILVPIAFVSEHIETLVELDIEYGHLARDAGVPDYVRVPALGVNAGYIQALRDEVQKAIASDVPVVGDHDCAACHRFCPKGRAA